MCQRNTFTKEERLCGELRVSELFQRGNNVVAYPLRACWRLLPSESETENNRLSEGHASCIQVLMSVPKKKLRRANKRNRAKRLMREAYRLNKHPLAECVEAKSQWLQIAFVWIPDTLEDYALVFSKMKKLLEKIQVAVEADGSNS